MSNAHRCLLLGKSIYHLKIWPSSLRNSWLRAIYRHPVLINLLVSCTVCLTPKIMSGEQTVIKLKLFLLYCLLTVIVFELQYQTLLSATFSIVRKQKWIKMKINLKGDGREGVALDSKEKKKKNNKANLCSLIVLNQQECEASEHAFPFWFAEQKTIPLKTHSSHMAVLFHFNSIPLRKKKLLQKNIPSIYKC